ncbi:hypothetical protein [Enterobacter ludwigii]|uniref:hypothetical protein n=1 Tax=Enterobacter ludwigii TaxID=299767 RepID=UPI002E2B9B89|nr:hypothetical protein [Enterobacter ludwigii]MED5700037.1 hypothetical protein [Enterobacter ludwigii]
MSNAIDVHLTDEVINAAFENTNFGRSDFRTILAETVLKRATGNYSGWKVKNKEQLMQTLPTSVVSFKAGSK